MTGQDIIATIDDALDDWGVSNDAMRWTPDSEAVLIAEPPMPPLADLGAMVRSMQTWAIQVAEAWTKVAAKIKPWMRSVNRVLARAREREAMKRHQPIALSINGHEYHCRQRNRKRRR